MIATTLVWLIAMFLVLAPGRAPERAASLRALSVTLANSTTNNLIGAFIGALLGTIVGKHILWHAAAGELAAEKELQRLRLTETDIVNLKQIATAAEEYAVDNGGNYPASLDGLIPPYLDGNRYIPNSDPPVKYIFEHPSLNPKFGIYDVRDNGTFDPTVDKLRNVLDDSLCTRQTCKYIIYTQSGGIGGMP